MCSSLNFIWQGVDMHRLTTMIFAVLMTLLPFKALKQDIRTIGEFSLEDSQVLEADLL
jgi:hypothetical protein